MPDITTQKHRIAVYGRTIEASLYRPATAGRTSPVPGILFLHEIFGVTRQVTADVLELAGLGYAVLAPDLYSDMGATRFCIREFFNEAGVKNRSDNPALQEVFTVLDYLKTLDGVDAGRIGAVGMCLTGGFIIHLAKRPELKAPVIFHHSLGLFGAGAPRRDVAGVQNTIQAHFVPNDLFCPKLKQENLKNALGEKLEVHFHPDGHHGLRSRDRNRPAGREAWTLTKEFFRQHLA